MLKRLLTQLVDAYAHWIGFTFPLKYGLRWKLEVLLKSYEPATTRIFQKKVRSGMVVIDIGAHIGYYTRIASKRVGSRGKVVAFEADTENLALLRHNVSRLKNVTIVPLAVSSEEGEASFYHVPGSTGCHSLVAPSSSIEPTKVQTTTLDNYLETQGIARVDFVKMDIEGGEWKALEGMKKVLSQDSLQLVMEYNPTALKTAGIEPADILIKLQQYGFTVYALVAYKPIAITPQDIQNMEPLLSDGGSVNIYCTK